jgi:hypothetical protein
MTATLDIPAAQEQLLDSIKQSQQFVLDAVRAAAEAAPALPITIPTPAVDLPDPAEAVAQSFDFAERLLANQRAFFEQLFVVTSEPVAAPTATPTPTATATQTPTATTKKTRTRSKVK